jgi:hypothetical protein
MVLDFGKYNHEKNRVAFGSYIYRINKKANYFCTNFVQQRLQATFSPSFTSKVPERYLNREARLMKKLLAAILLLSGFTVQAQYAKIRFPQDPAEIKLFKSLGVLGQLERVEKEGKRMTVRARAFDSSGRLIGDLQPASSKYWVYNQHGQVIAFRDTTTQEDNTRKGEEYTFIYRDDFPPIIQQAVFPYGSADFKYDGKNNYLVEVGKYTDTTWTSYYYYDDQFRTKIIYHYANNKLVHTEKMKYSDDNLLYTEMSVDHYDDGSDSASIVYQYNDKKQLVKKAVFHYSKVTTNDDNGRPTLQASQFVSETIDYTYNDKGQLIAEEYNHSMNKFAHQYRTYTYDDRGLKIKATVREGSAEPVTYIYEYGFFNGQ